MNFDSHVHLVGEGWVHDDFFLGLARIFAAVAGKVTGEPPDAAAMVGGLKGALFDTSGERLITEMDEAGVEGSCIFTVDYGLLTGESGVSIEEQNKVIANVVKRFPDRLMGYFSIDPRRPGALDLFFRAVEEWGLRGLKLHPSSGWCPADEVAYPLYRQCMEYKLPLLIHTGGQPAPMRSRFGRPAYVDDVAADFPDLSIIMAHCGYTWWEEALMVCTMKPNCYVDFSGWQSNFMGSPLSFYQVLRHAVDLIGPWKVLFGSDGPYLNGFCPLKDWVAAFRSPQIPSTEVSFTGEEIDIIMGRAFLRLLGDR